MDDDFNVKVADFRLTGPAQPSLSHVSTRAQGTSGHLDPEYYLNYQLNDKSDMYSYGVVLPELLTSQKAIDLSCGEDDVNLAVFVNQKAKDRNLIELVDRKLLGKELSAEI